MFRAGNHPGMVVPFCRLCDLPVARLRYRVPREDVYAIEFEADCCGRTVGRRVSLADMARARYSGEKLYLVVTKRQSQGFRQQAKL